MRIENSLASGVESAVHALEQVFAQVGDMLGDIAERYGVSASALRDANPGLGDRLLPGQPVRLPADGHAAPAAADHTPGAAAPRSSTYTVRSGDTMSGVAKAQGVSLQALIEANPQLSNVNRIAVGQTLNLPGASIAPEHVPAAGRADSAAAGHAASPDGTPLYRQGDAAWGQTVLGHSRTISQAGCAMTSVAMAISKISGHSIDPGQLDRYLDQHHGYAGDALKWDTAAQAAGLHGGKQAWSLQTVNRQLDAGRPVVVGVDYRAGSNGGPNGTDHWIAITARGQENGKPVYFANDPATGKQIKLYENNGQLKQQDGKGYRTTGELVVFTGGGAATPAAAPASPARPAAPAPAAAPVSPVTPTAAPAAHGITAAQLHQIMPQADTARWVDKLNAAMAAHGIDTPTKQAAFLAQIGVESGQLRRTSENLNYSASRLTEVWPSRFPTIASATPYAHNPEKLANHVYANRNGNGNEASGDGWKYRGGGLMQTTGRANYRSAGFENNPERLREDATAADSAAHFWQSNGLNERTASALDHNGFNGVTRTVNGGLNGANERWQMYQRALSVLSH